MKEYSPLKVLELEGRIGQTKVVNIEDDLSICFKEKEQFEFLLINFNDRSKIDFLEFSVHLFYKFSC